MAKSRSRKKDRRSRKNSRKGSRCSSKLRLVRISKSPKKDKKYMAVFEKDCKQKTTHFGSRGYSDFTKHKNPSRMRRYTQRHKSRENWRDPTTAGALSKYVLWNKPSLRASIADYKRRFKL